MKKGQVTMFILVGLFFVATLALYAWLKADTNLDVEEKECSIDLDCVPKECCDADLCVPIDEAPDCDGESALTDLDDVRCEPGCKSYGDIKLLGCGVTLDGSDRGSCKCVNQKCAPS